MEGTETIIVHRRLASDRFGDPTGWAADRTVKRCIIVPRTSDEINGRQSTTIIGLTVYAPPLSDIKPVDQVTARGARWQVDGEPGDYRSVAGQRKTLAVNLRRVEG